MQSDIAKKIEKIFSAFNKVDKLPKAIIRYGAQFFLALFAAGTLLFLLNRTYLDYNPDFEYTAISIIKSSFSILAETVIGGLVLDYIFKK